MEVFSILINKATRGGYLRSYNFRNSFGDVTNISHLLFAVDTLVFCKDSDDEMLYLNWILLYFEALSRLRINLDKSVILPVGKVENLNQLASELGCRVGSLHSSYLRLPLGYKVNSSRLWEGIEEKFIKKLAAWKIQYISKGERLTLIKARCLICLYACCHFLGCPKVSKIDWRKFIEIFSGEEALQLEKFT